MRRFSPYALVLLLAACDGPGADRPAPAPPPDEAPGLAWRTNPREQVTLETEPVLSLSTGPHTIAWVEGAGPLEPPYIVGAAFHKRRGRLHEAYGLLFGGERLDAPETDQVYSYFLVRGDGSYLVKRRAGAETPVVRDWTRHPAVIRDGEDGGRENVLEVEAGADEAVFRINGQEVARVPAAELDLRGHAGVRVSHEVRVDVRDFQAVPAAHAASP
jgi:hypothetical protein